MKRGYSMTKKALDQVMEFRRMMNGFWVSRLILTANNFDIFNRLTVPRSALAAAKILKTDGRATEIVLDALTAIGLLRKAAGKYRTSPMATNFLVDGAPYYQGDMVRHADTLWKNWSALDESLKKGKPTRKAENYRAFINAMNNNASLRVRDVVNALDLKGVRSALDLGGGPGTYSREMAGRGVDVTLYDLPDAIAIARKITKNAGARNIRFMAGDFLKNPIGTGYDLVFISQVLHSLSEREILSLLRKSRTSLTPGGKIVIQEFSLDNERTSPVQGALFAVNMLVNTDAGRSYTAREIKGWLAKTGLSGVKEKRMNETVLITAGKKKT